jgi:hypothetical protein
MNLMKCVRTAIIVICLISLTVRSRKFKTREIRGYNQFCSEEKLKKVIALEGDKILKTINEEFNNLSNYINRINKSSRNFDDFHLHNQPNASKLSIINISENSISNNLNRLLPTSIEDFYKKLFETKPHLVVDLCNKGDYTNEKCVSYFCDHSSCEFGQVKLSKLDEACEIAINQDNITCSVYNLEIEGVNHKMSYLKYTDWPRYSSPLKKDYRSILNVFGFVDELNKVYPNVPIVVNSSVDMHKADTFLAYFKIYKSIQDQAHRGKFLNQIEFNFLEMAKSFTSGERNDFTSHNDHYTGLYRFFCFSASLLAKP